MCGHVSSPSCARWTSRTPTIPRSRRGAFQAVAAPQGASPASAATSCSRYRRNLDSWPQSATPAADGAPPGGGASRPDAPDSAGSGLTSIASSASPGSATGVRRTAISPDHRPIDAVRLRCTPPTARVIGGDSAQIIPSPAPRRTGARPLAAALYFGLSHVSRGRYLALSDRLSMAHSSRSACRCGTMSWSKKVFPLPPT